MMTNQQRIDLIRERLQMQLKPTQLDIVDESQQHVGHPGAASGAGHFAVMITTDLFSGKNLVERHRLVYQAIGDLMEKEIHALRIQAKTPAEIQ